VQTSAGRTRPVVPEFDWPDAARQVIVPCAGRIQPEHILKAFESGASLVAVVACREDNCHYIEGSPRCARRADYIRSILNEIGLGDERLLLLHLPGSAVEDLAVASGKTDYSNGSGSLGRQVNDVRDRVIQAFQVLSPNPLMQRDPAGILPNSIWEETDLVDDTKDE
jgi:coenzyme F420-reducing hydrogenase delta subunit